MSGPVGPVIPDWSPGPSSESVAAANAANELTVYGGGIGSTVDIEVSTEDIRACASQISALASRLRHAGSRARVCAYGLSSTAHLTSFGALSLDRAWDVVHSADSRAASLDDLAERLQVAAQGYEDSEDAAAAVTWRIFRAPFVFPFFPLVHIQFAAALAAADAVAHGQEPWAFTREGTGMFLRESIYALTGMDDGVENIAALVAAGVLPYNSNRATIRSIVPNAMAGGAEQITDTEGLVNAIGALYPEAGNVPPGSFRIDRMVAADGQVSGTVIIPGTQDDIVGFNPNNWASNPGAMVGGMTAVANGVIAGVIASGFKPGDTINLAGHSQGAMVSVVVANALVDAGYKVPGVLSVGGPIGLISAPAATEVLAVEHREDPVPGADDAPPPVSENLTWVDRPLSESTDPLAMSVHDPTGSHGVDMYVNTAALVDASDNDAIQDALAAWDAQFDPDAEVTTFYYQATRDF